MFTHISREQRVHGKGPSFTFVIGSEDNEDVLDADDEGDGPDDK